MSNILQDHRAMVTNLAKPGDTIRTEISPVEAHLLHMLVIGGEYGELIEAYRDLNCALNAHALVERSPVTSPLKLIAAKDVIGAREVLLNECGDYTFFLAGFRIGLELANADGLEVERTGDYSHRHSGLLAPDLLVELAVIQGDLIDAVKRVAIYRKGYPNSIESQLGEIPAARQEALRAERRVQYDRAAYALDQIEVILGHLFTAFGHTMEQVLQANMDKLIAPDKGRYAAGTYSDAAAVERADVGAGEDDLSVVPVIAGTKGIDWGGPDEGTRTLTADSPVPVLQAPFPASPGGTASSVEISDVELVAAAARAAFKQDRDTAAAPPLQPKKALSLKPAKKTVAKEAPATEV